MQIQTKRKLEYPYLDKSTKKKTNKRQKKRRSFFNDEEVNTTENIRFENSYTST